jgi:hypothetical protein
VSDRLSRKRRLWRFLSRRVFFPYPAYVLELKEGTPERANWLAERKAAEQAISRMSLGTVQVLTEIYLRDMAEAEEDLVQTRQRAAQLLAATGFVGVLSGLVQSLTTNDAYRGIIVGSLIVLAVVFLGTIWNTVSALRVVPWERIRIDPILVRSPLAIRREYLKDLFVAARQHRYRLTVPVGALRDAYYFFAATVLLLGFFVGLKILVAPANAQIEVGIDNVERTRVMDVPAGALPTFTIPFALPDILSTHS